jgi:hypothetical protein
MNRQTSAWFQKFVRMLPDWDKFRFLGTLKDMIYTFLPIAEKMAMDYDKNDAFLAYLDKLIMDIRDRNEMDNRNIDHVLKPAAKISLGLLAGDPAWRNIAMRFIASIRYGKEPPFTAGQKAWLKQKYGIDCDGQDPERVH